MKNNYFSRCVLLAGLCSVIMVFAVTPVYATGDSSISLLDMVIKYNLKYKK